MSYTPDEDADRWAAKLLRQIGKTGDVPQTYPARLKAKEQEEPKPLPINAIRVTRRAEPGTDGISLYTLEITNIKTQSGQHILMEVLPRVLELFLVKNQDYGDDMGAMRLGPKGQFVDIWRKVGKLKRSLWDGEKMNGEQSDEMLMDLVGHVLLSLSDMWRKN